MSSSVTDDMLYAIDNIQTFQIVLAAISVVFSGSVLFILTHFYNDLVKGKPFIHIILMMAISDTMSSLSLSLGFPTNKVLCSIQGFTYIFFERCTWFFLDFLVIQLFYFARSQKLLFSIRTIHYIVWPTSVILQILPFLTKTGYGSPTDDLQDDTIQVGVCFYSRYHGSLDAYFLSSIFFTIELLVSFFLVLGFTVGVSCLRNSANDTSLVMALLPVVSTIRETVILYPLAQLLTTIPGIVYAIYHIWYLHAHDGVYPKHYVSRQDLLIAITPINSILFTIIFYAKTKEALIKWKSLFMKINDDSDDRLWSVDSNIEINKT